MTPADRRLPEEGREVAARRSEVGYLQLLRNNLAYRRLWYGAVASDLGDWFSTIAIYLLIEQLTGSPFALGLVYFSWQPLPADPMLLIHLSMVLVLMFIFPFSKLLHAPGVFFSPGRNQVDNPREKRHLAPWAAALDADRQKSGANG